jgi:hypothetical protein
MRAFSGERLPIFWLRLFPRFERYEFRNRLPVTSDEKFVSLLGTANQLRKIRFKLANADYSDHAENPWLSPAKGIF